MRTALQAKASLLFTLSTESKRAMPIQCTCGSCGATMKVADKFAGKKAKCPKCGAAIEIPAPTNAGDSLFGDDLLLADETPRAKPKPTGTGWGSGGNVRSHLDDLLDEAGVEARVEGPTCPACGAAVEDGAILCISCGLNFQTGEKVYSHVAHDPDQARKQMSETEKIMARAEADIEVNPISNEDSGYGDGPESFLLAAAAFLIGTLLVAVVVGVVFLFDKLASNNAGAMTIAMFVISTIFAIIGKVWIMVSAFKESLVQGILTLMCDLYVPIYGIIHMRELWMPTICYFMAFGAAIAGAANYYGQ